MRNNLGQYGNTIYRGYSANPSMMPGHPYGVPGIGYPGYAMGMRVLDWDETLRLARERYDYQTNRAEETQHPEYRYLSPEGNHKVVCLVRALQNQVNGLGDDQQQQAPSPTAASRWGHYATGAALMLAAWVLLKKK